MCLNSVIKLKLNASFLLDELDLISNGAILSLELRHSKENYYLD